MRDLSNGPENMFRGAPEVSDEEKDAVWRAYRAGTPIRVPVTLATNPRVVVLDPQWNAGGWTFERVFNDPDAMFEVSLRHEFFRRAVINRYCDSPTTLPDEWTASVHWQNVYEAAFFGATIQFRDGQVPDVLPCLHAGNREEVFRVDIEHPLQRGIFRKGLEFYERMCELAEGREFHGRPVRVARYAQTGCDGPLTVAMCLRGPDVLAELVEDPAYADRLLGFITEAAIRRVHAFRAYWDDERIGAGLADDSIQLIGTPTYRQRVMPHHRAYYDAFWPDRPRAIHLCGDVQRHMPTLVRELNVRSWDSGFPVDFRRAREELGPDVEILGGPPVSLLLAGSPKQVYDETCRILESGIMAGGKFILREANNLPPGVPEANLAAMYRAALDNGRY